MTLNRKIINKTFKGGTALPNIVHRGKIILVDGPEELVKLAIKSHLFNNWLKNLDRDYTLLNIAIQSVDTTGTDENVRVLFIKLRATARDSHGTPVPGIVFLRGNSVAMLIVLQCFEKNYALLVEKGRFPTGKAKFTEIPTGMLDGSGNFSGIAAKELWEKAEIAIRPEDLIDLNEIVYGKACDGIYPSPGSCDEKLRFYLAILKIAPDQLSKIPQFVSGAANDNENICLRRVPLSNLHTSTYDMKTIVAHALLHEAMQRDKMLMQSFKLAFTA